ncbi:EthD family reductase [Acinetobacter pollinis]|uniref:EthD family reductase n=1 Tax=Acinetobacter pollinis TaxID=2605270 RepID=A0ABU6DXA3_9GAMM|nr:EthD family reductase [Acinetobacter pollinis]MEB5477814.1 EthD family reductase [Acinetobacter pollinis]
MSKNYGFKYVSFLYKKDHQTFDEFVSYWTEVHAEIAIKLPKLRKYVINPIDRRQSPESPVDGFCELWFDSLEDADEAFSSSIGSKAFQDITNFVERAVDIKTTEIEKSI